MSDARHGNCIDMYTYVCVHEMKYVMQAIADVCMCVHMHVFDIYDV